MQLSAEQLAFLKAQSVPDLCQHRLLAERGLLLDVRPKPRPGGEAGAARAPAPTGGPPREVQRRFLALSAPARAAFALPGRVAYFLRAEPLFALPGARERLIAWVRDLSGMVDMPGDDLLALLAEIRVNPEKTAGWLQWVEETDRAGAFVEVPVN